MLFNSIEGKQKSNFNLQDAEFEPVDNDLHSVLGRPCELTEDFKRHYDVWLQQEVISMTINWDLLLSQKKNNDDSKNLLIVNNLDNMRQDEDHIEVDKLIN